MSAVIGVVPHLRNLIDEKFEMLSFIDFNKPRTKATIKINSHTYFTARKIETGIKVSLFDGNERGSRFFTTQDVDPSIVNEQVTEFFNELMVNF